MTHGKQAFKERGFGLLAIPAALISGLPVISCPLCWPAYTALLSSLGVGFVNYSPYLLPLTAAFLAIALAGLGLQARRSQYIPFLLGIVSAAGILAGKFLLSSSPVAYAGIALLLVASGWSVVSERKGSLACGTAGGRVACGPAANNEVISR